MKRGAEISTCGRYRYHLSRVWGEGERPRMATFVMLNPSTADAEKDDATVRKCVGFTKRWGLDGLNIVNLFAWRSTDPAGLLEAEDPVGPDNDAWISRMTSSDQASVVVAAWGAHGTRHQSRVAFVRALLPYRSIMCLKLTATRQPVHPLIQPYALALQPWIGR